MNEKVVTVNVDSPVSGVSIEASLDVLVGSASFGQENIVELTMTPDRNISLAGVQDDAVAVGVTIFRGEKGPKGDPGPQGVPGDAVVIPLSKTDILQLF